MSKYRILVFLGLIASFASQAQPPIPADTALASYQRIEIKTHDGFTLGGHLALPKHVRPPYPAVLLLVGSGPGNRYENVPAAVTANFKPALLFRPIEEALLAKGIAVMTYDKRGITPKDDTFLEADVDRAIWATATANNLAADALAAFDVLQSQSQIDLARLGVLGHSEGTILALKVAEQRSSSVKSLLMLGLLTRSMADIFVYQGVTDAIRLFSTLDENADGYLVQSELEAVIAADPVLGTRISWPGLQNMDRTGDGRISEQEFRYALEEQIRQFKRGLQSGGMPMPGEPREWFLQYFAEGAYLARQLKFCSKIHLFQGELDIQTPFEDALQLDAACKQQGTPLASFISFPNEGHGFSPRIGYKQSRDTIGPVDSKLPPDVAEQAAHDLLVPSWLVHEEAEVRAR